MKENYFKTIVEIERMNRLFLDVVKNELNRMRIRDINEIQCIILYRLGDRQVCVGDLRRHGHYLGTNVSHNMSKMIKNGYFLKNKNPDDTRSSLVRLSKKGIALQKKLEGLFSYHANSLEKGGIDLDALKKTEHTLLCIGSFWSNLLSKVDSAHEEEA